MSEEEFRLEAGSGDQQTNIVLISRQRKLSSSSCSKRLSHQTTMRSSRSTLLLLLMGACFLFIEAHSHQGEADASTMFTYKPNHRKHHQHHHHRRAFNPEDRRLGGDERLDLENSHNENKQQPQVPEQLPIVVSSSDNSYVSASPIIITTTTTTTTPAPHHHFSTSRHHHNHQHPSHHLQDNRRQQPTSNEISTTASNNDEGTTKRSWHRLWSPHRNHPHPISSSSTDEAYESISGGSSSTTISARRDNKLDGHQLIQNKISDISTTATTTPRHNYVLSDTRHHKHSHQNHSPTKSTEANSLISRFEIKLATIINTQESIEAGASFINYTVVTNFDACLVECWITDSCDTAIYQESTIASAAAIRSPSASSSFSEQNVRHLHSNSLVESTAEQNSIYHICFLFECIKSRELKCQFSPHENYVSSILMKKVATARGEHNDSDSDNNSVVAAEEDCDLDLEFKCSSPDGCIPRAKRCDGIADCADGSDERLEECSSSGGEYHTLTSRRRSIAVPQLRYSLADEDESLSTMQLEPVIQSHKPEAEHQYSRIISNSAPHLNHPINGHHHRGGHWQDIKIVSISIGESEEYPRSGLDSALIATLFGVAITGMLIMIVGHKMRSIRRRLAYRSRRRSLVPDKELFINATTMSTPTSSNNFNDSMMSSSSAAAAATMPI